MTHAHAYKLAALGCALTLAGGIAALGASGTAFGEEAAGPTANPYVGVQDTTYGDEDTAHALIASGATFSDLNDAGISVLLDEGGKLMFDPHNGHYDFACTDCHRGAADSTQTGTAETTDHAQDDAATAAEAPVLMCNTCHRITLPDGWENPAYNLSTKPLFVDPLTIYGDLGYGTSGVSYGVPYSNADGQ